MLENNDSTKITLIFGNRSTKDILLKKEFDEIVKSKKINLTVVYTIDKKEDDWDGEVGYISRDLISKYCGDITSDGTFVLTCGPPPMCESLKSIIKSMGVKDSNYHDF